MDHIQEHRQPHAKPRGGVLTTCRLLHMLRSFDPPLSTHVAFRPHAYVFKCRVSTSLSCQMHRMWYFEDTFCGPCTRVRAQGLGISASRWAAHTCVALFICRALHGVKPCNSAHAPSLVLGLPSCFGEQDLTQCTDDCHWPICDLDRPWAGTQPIRELDPEHEIRVYDLLLVFATSQAYLDPADGKKTLNQACKLWF